jgi:hypothetical protein
VFLQILSDWENDHDVSYDKELTFENVFSKNLLMVNQKLSVVGQPDDESGSYSGNVTLGIPENGHILMGYSAGR